jgi:hypothetical protein
MPVNPGGNPGGPGEGNRMRNTMANLLSKNKVQYQNPGGAAALPALSPAQTANYYSQLAGLAAQARLTKASLKAERVGVRADWRAQRAGIQLERKQGIADVQAQMSDRGLTGSSIHATGEVDVRAAARSALTAGKGDVMQAIGQNRIAQQQAGLDFFMGASALEAQSLATKQEALSQQLAQNLIVSGQETQMDVLRQMFQAQMGMVQPGGTASAGRPTRGRSSGLRGRLFTGAREGGGY